MAIGSFGGIVSFVDPAATDSKGRVRVLVVPDPNDIDWPEPDLLRQQVRAQGWFMLDNVTLGWELWRRINGFPPTFDNAPDAEPKGYKPDAPASLYGQGGLEVRRVARAFFRATSPLLLVTCLGLASVAHADATKDALELNEVLQSSPRPPSQDGCDGCQGGCRRG